MSKILRVVLVATIGLEFSLITGLLLHIVSKKTDDSSSLPQAAVRDDYFLLDRVVDGDTIRAMVNGVSTSIRLIGVDAPELYETNSAAQCFSRESTDYLKGKLEGTTVRLEYDQIQGDRDAYNRLLSYIWLKDELINLSIIEAGFGREYTYNLPYKYSEQFRQAQTDAQAQKLGMWKTRTCVE